MTTCKLFAMSQVKGDGRVRMVTQSAHRGEMKAVRWSTIHPYDLVKPFPSEGNFNLDFKGELFHVATSSVRFILILAHSRNSRPKNTFLNLCINSTLYLYVHY